jgi:hypothetical protein
MPEWDMEKYRFYLDLPGDFWESGTLLRYLREREVQVRCISAYPYVGLLNRFDAFLSSVMWVACCCAT